MRNYQMFCLFFFVLVKTIWSAKIIVCYYPRWSHYSNLPVKDIDPNVCTHLIYAFVGIGSDGSIRVHDPRLELVDNGDLNILVNFNALKKINPNLKTLVSVGGWTEGSINFTKVVNDDSLRNKFADNALAFIKRYGFDGLDLDWEYPNARGGKPSDKPMFTALIKILREKFDQYGYLLSAAVRADKYRIDQSYEIPNLNKYLDFINVMTYNMRHPKNTEIGNNGPMYASSTESEKKKQAVISSVIDMLLNEGSSAGKLVIGIALYGHSFILADPNKRYPGAPSLGPGINNGSVHYRQICQFVNGGDWTEHWDDEQKVPYAFKGDQWIGYDNVRSVQFKSQYAMNKSLAGVMFWSLNQDDVRGDCGNKYPLVNAAKQFLNFTN